jgi:peptidoglycan/LPS O-acetylase OafA/YrhL
VSSLAPHHPPSAVAQRSPHPSSIDSLTSLRGFLALWVVFYHFWKDMLALFPRLDFLTPLAKQGHFAVPVFFMLSGFVLAYNYSQQLSVFSLRSYGRFLFMRWARIYPVHFFTLLVVLGMVIVCRVKGWQLTDAGYGAPDFVWNLLLVQTWVPNFQLNWNYPSWSISSEWFAYLCFPLFCAAMLRRITSRFRAYLLLIVCWAATIGLYVLGSKMPFRVLLEVIPTFLAGTAIFACQSAFPKVMNRHSPPSIHHPHVSPELLLLALGVVPLLTGGPIMVALLLTGFVALVYWLATLQNNSSGLWTNRFAIYLGEISYSLYMAHTLAQKVCYKLLPSDQFSGATLILRLGILGAYVTCIAIAVLGTYYLVERPSRRGLRGLFMGREESERQRRAA